MLLHLLLQLLPPRLALLKFRVFVTQRLGLGFAGLLEPAFVLVESLQVGLPFGECFTLFLKFESEFGDEVQVVVQSLLQLPALFRLLQVGLLKRRQLRVQRLLFTLASLGSRG